MFVVSVKTSKKKLFVFFGAVLMLILLCVLIFGKGGDENYAVSSSGRYSLSAPDNAARREFLAQFGWQTGEEPVEICEVIIPESFNEVYEKYNQIQKEQGLDLSRYMGGRCKRWTYEITNYPGQSEGVRANLLVSEGKVIGGDISSVALDGFMHGFERPQKGAEKENARAESPSSGQAATSAPQPPKTESGKEASISSGETSAPASSWEEPPFRSTERETLAPDPQMPEAPTD